MLTGTFLNKLTPWWLSSLPFLSLRFSSLCVTGKQCQRPQRSVTLFLYSYIPCLLLYLYRQSLFGSMEPFPNWVGHAHRVHTEWQCPLSGVHSIMMVKSACLVRVGGAHPPLFTFLSHHHEQSCGVRYSWEGRYTPHSPYFFSALICNHWSRHLKKYLKCRDALSRHLDTET